MYLPGTLLGPRETGQQHIANACPHRNKGVPCPRLFVPSEQYLLATLGLISGREFPLAVTELGMTCDFLEHGLVFPP